MRFFGQNGRLWGLLVVLLAAAALPACGGENTLPAMERIADQTVRVGDTLTLVVRAADADGDALTFYVAGKPPGARFTQAGDAATLTWSPSVTDAEAGGRAWPVAISVQDSTGAWVSQDFEITVFLQGGIPAFVNPPGYVLDLATDEYVAFRVEVKDDDSTRVALALRREIEGALWREDGPKAAVFYWEPTADQIKERVYWSILVEADDGINPPVPYEISIILLNPAAARDCPGQPPNLRHTPLGDQRGGSGYEVRLEAFDIESDVRFPTVFWAPGADPDPVTIRPVAMQADPASPGTFVATLPPSPSSDRAGFVSYSFTASDNDDAAASRCDHVGRLPKRGNFVFAWYAPGTSEDYCIQDDMEPNDSLETATELPPRPYAGLRLCPGDVDWYRTAVGPGVRATLTLRHVAEHGEARFAVQDESGVAVGEASRFGDRTVLSVPPSGVERILLTKVEGRGQDQLTYALDIELSQSECEEDGREPDDTLETATLVEAPGATFDSGTVCAGDPDWFLVAAGNRQHLTVTLDISPLDGDLDVVVIAPDGATELAKVERTGVNHEELSLNLDQAGAYYVVVYSHEGRNGAYALNVALRDQTVSCQDDSLGPNQDRASAPTLPEATWDDLTLCPGRPDWYQIGVNAGERVHAAALSEQGDAFTVTLYDPTGASVLAEAASVEGWAEVSADALGAGDYPIRVQGTAIAAFPYLFQLWVDKATGACAEDRFAPNHDAPHAVLVEPIFTTRLRTCNGTPDWFRFEAPPETRVFVIVEVRDAEAGALGLDVYDRELNQPIASSREPGRTAQSVEFVTDLLGGTYFIEVSPAVPGGSVADQVYDIGLVVD